MTSFTEKSKILLVLDVDETLVYASTTELGYPASFETSIYKIYKRTYLDEFLKEVSLHYQVGFWSSASNNYVKNVVSKITASIFEPKFVWGRSRCNFELRNEKLGRESHFNYVKKLEKITTKFNIPLEQIIIIDDTPHKAKYNKENAIYINSWTGKKGDTELLKLSKILTEVSGCFSITDIKSNEALIDFLKESH